MTFIDGWPEDFFLQEGRNTLGICSRGCKISFKEFSKVTTGILTLDTIRLIENYLKTFPQGSKDWETLMRCGHAILNVKKESFTQYAVQHFKTALDAAAHLWLAACCSKASAEDAKIYHSLVIETEKYASKFRLQEKLTPEELCRAANSFGKLQQLDIVLALTDFALKKDPFFEDAYWLKSIALIGNYPKLAIENGNHALDINSKEIIRLEQEANKYGDRKLYQGPVNLALGNKRNRRIQELQILVNAAAKTGEFKIMNQAYMELNQLKKS